MAKTTKVSVVTAVGTFKRSTVRVYTHIVVVGPVKFEALEASRLAGIKHQTEEAARYRATIARGFDPTDRTAFHREFTASKLADGSYEKWASDTEAAAAKLVAQGPITVDDGEPFVLGWCGRPDLAHKLRTSTQAARYRWARVYDVTTGQEAF